MSQVNKDYHEFLLSILLPFENFRYVPMIGGYIYYYDNKIFGGIYGNAHFMVKITETSKKYMPDATVEPPYEGAKPMMNVTVLDNPELLKQMICEMAEELPKPKLSKSVQKRISAKQ